VRADQCGTIGFGKLVCRLFLLAGIEQGASDENQQQNNRGDDEDGFCFIWSLSDVLAGATLR